MADVQSLVTTITGAVTCVHTDTQDDGSIGTDPVTMPLADSLTNGTGNDQADLVFHQRKTLTTGATQNYDLAAALVDEFGTTLTFVAIKALYIRNLNASRALTVGGGAQPWLTWVAAAADAIVIPPMGIFLLTAPLAGFAVTADTGDDLLVTNAAGGDTIFDILIIGTSA